MVRQGCRSWPPWRLACAGAAASSNRPPSSDPNTSDPGAATAPSAAIAALDTPVAHAVPLPTAIVGAGLFDQQRVQPDCPPSAGGVRTRQQGTYTFLSYVIIALLTAAHLRTPAQLRRVQRTIIIVTSLPIALYAIVQHFGVDPLPWDGNITMRSAANVGTATPTSRPRLSAHAAVLYH